MPEGMRSLEAHIAHPRCPYCHEGVAPADTKTACTVCMAWFHRDCWGELGGRCATCGHVDSRSDRPALRVETPPPETIGADEAGTREWDLFSRLVVIASGLALASVPAVLLGLFLHPLVGLVLAAWVLYRLYRWTSR
jgi:hypothetical protein